jgi:hypothetical protein
MCDTMGVVPGGNGSLFAKNSDRGPNEPQVLEFRPAMDHTSRKLKATYMEIDQVPHTHGTLISRPVWMWGAEIGVNEFGLCIGNEAVFTRGSYKKTGLTGMDLLRLALERCKDAKEALEYIIVLLEEHGQGGNCGYDHSFYYDNSFLIMDPLSLYVLETAGRCWAWRSAERISISNRLSLGANAEAYSGGKRRNFAGRYSDPVFSFFSGSAKRRELSSRCVSEAGGVSALIAGLRLHEDEKTPLIRSSIRSPCMHAGGKIGDHSTASLAAELGTGGKPLLWLTGSSTPCISLFKPWSFGNPLCPPVFKPGGGESYWRRQEQFRRMAIGRILPGEFYAERDELEGGWIQASRGADGKGLDALSRRAAQEEEQFYAKWEQRLPENRYGKKSYLAYWKKKTAELERPARPAVSGD